MKFLPYILLTVSAISLTFAMEVSPLLEGGGGQTGATPGDFEMYVFAQTWTESFCSGNKCSSQECKSLPGTYAASNLAIHGLWPNFNDESTHSGYQYPQFCGSYSTCGELNPPASCNPDMSNLNQSDFTKYAPGYVMDNNFLANHEWPKHGGCTRLSQQQFFQSLITLEKQLEATSSAVWTGSSVEVKLTDVEAAYGGSDHVSLTCSKGNLQQVITCWSKDAQDMPVSRIPCPATVAPSNCPSLITLATSTCNS